MCAPCKASFNVRWDCKYQLLVLHERILKNLASNSGRLKVCCLVLSIVAEECVRCRWRERYCMPVLQWIRRKKTA